MKTRTIIFSAIWLTIFINIGCSNSNNESVDNQSYAQALNLARKNRNKELKNSPSSPIPATKRERFVGLNHYDPNENWVLKARVELVDSLSVFKLATSTGELREMTALAILHFNVNNQPFKLTGYGELNPSTTDLFIPFYDETNGTGTYAGGRYMELNLSNTDSIILDFNQAFNPYCHYNTKFSCPIPPNENSLNIAITAGEKTLYH